MIVHDRFGGEMLRTVNEGVIHYWIRVNDIDIDLTRDQSDSWAPGIQWSLSTLITSDRADRALRLAIVDCGRRSITDPQPVIGTHAMTNALVDSRSSWST